MHTNVFLGAFCILGLQTKLPEVSGSHFVLSHLDVVIFVMKTYCDSWVLLRCSGILCVISPVYVGIIIYISPALSFVLNIRASVHCSGLQLWRFQQCRVGLFSYNSCTCKITGASWVVPVLLLWLKIQMTLIKNFSLLYVEPAGLLTSSAVLCEEDVLCLIL